MDEPQLAVVIPVGPEKRHASYLGEALQSLHDQWRRPDLVLLVDDMHYLNVRPHPAWEFELETYVPPWRLGPAHAWNLGCALALHSYGADLALMMGADDWLEPACLRALVETYQQHPEDPDGYYHLDVRYSESGDLQELPCNAAAVTRGLWRETGGLPIEGAAGQMDAAYISQLMVHLPHRLRRVVAPEGGRYVWRQHPGQETGRITPQVSDALITIRDWVTETYRRTQWGRYR